MKNKLSPVTHYGYLLEREHFTQQHLWHRANAVARRKLQNADKYNRDKTDFVWIKMDNWRLVE